MSSYAFPTAAVLGSTGLVGSNILTTLLTHPSLQVTTISRRAPKPAESDPKPESLSAILEPDTASWASKLSSVSPAPHTVFSGLGTTRAAAGGVANQWKIDHDLNIELAKAAKEAGVKNFVFISSGGTRGFLSSAVPYAKMKIGVEDTLRDLDFEHAVILRPGVIMGERETPKFGNAAAAAVARALGSVSQGWQDAVGQDAEVIARAAVRAAEVAAQGKAPDKFWVVEQADIVRMGRTEWNEGQGTAE